MSKISITPNASGTGVFTISSPATNTNRTLTLPDEAGTVLTSASSLASANLTGALPAIDGSALTSLPLLGVGQSWTDVTGSRSVNTVYTNSTGKPIMVSVGLDIVAGEATVNWFYVGAVIVAHLQNVSAEAITTTSFIVPNGSTYKHQYQSVAPTIHNWSELS
jgi:hypothetical protein